MLSQDIVVFTTGPLDMAGGECSGLTAHVKQKIEPYEYPI